MLNKVTRGEHVDAFLGQNYEDLLESGQLKYSFLGECPILCAFSWSLRLRRRFFGLLDSGSSSSMEKKEWRTILSFFMDDVSGNISKRWNKHFAIYYSSSLLPREILELRHCIAINSAASGPLYPRWSATLMVSARGTWPERSNHICRHF